MSNVPYTSTDYLSNKLTSSELTITYETFVSTQPKRQHKMIEYVWVSDGEGSIEINRTYYPLKKGSLVQILPYHVSRLILHGTQNIVCYRLQFSIRHLVLTASHQDAYLQSIQSLDQHQPVLKLNERLFKLLTFIFKNSYNDLSTGSQICETSLIPLISHIFYTKRPQEALQEKSYSLSGRVLTLMESNLTYPLSIDECALGVGIKPLELNQRIKRLTGSNYTLFYRLLRLYYGIALMQYKDLEHDRIAKYCGFKDITQFQSMFTLLFHTTPVAFRLRQEFFPVRNLGNRLLVSGYLFIHCNEPQQLKNMISSLNQGALNETIETTFGISVESFIRNSQDRLVSIYNQLRD